MEGGGNEAGLECFKVCFFYDAIPSVAVDIVLLPFTLIYELLRSKEPVKTPNR